MSNKFVSNIPEKRELGLKWFNQLVGELTQDMIDSYNSLKVELNLPDMSAVDSSIDKWFNNWTITLSLDIRREHEQVLVDIPRLQFIADDYEERDTELFPKEDIINLTNILIIFDKFQKSKGLVYSQRDGKLATFLYSYFGSDAEVRTYYLLKKIASNTDEDTIDIKTKRESKLATVTQKGTAAKIGFYEPFRKHNFSQNELEQGFGILLQTLVRGPFAFYFYILNRYNLNKEKFLHFIEKFISKSIFNRKFHPLVSLHFLVYFFEVNEKEIKKLLGKKLDEKEGDLSMIIVTNTENLIKLMMETPLEGLNKIYIEQNKKEIEKAYNGVYGKELCICKPQSGAGKRKRKKTRKKRKRRKRSRKCNKKRLKKKMICHRGTKKRLKKLEKYTKKLKLRLTKCSKKRLSRWKN